MGPELLASEEFSIDGCPIYLKLYRFRLQFKKHGCSINIEDSEDRFILVMTHRADVGIKDGRFHLDYDPTIKPPGLFKTLKEAKAAFEKDADVAKHCWPLIEKGLRTRIIVERLHIIGVPFTANPVRDMRMLEEHFPVYRTIVYEEKMRGTY